MDAATSQQRAHAGAQHFCEIVRERLDPESRKNALVAGCGSGEEALFIREVLGIPVIGVDIVRHWADNFGAKTENFTLSRGSVLELPFGNNCFDMVFYHHVIEHVSDPARSIEELFRVLTPGGLIYVGTPNRHRMIGYLGSNEGTRYEKMRWNINDYKARLRGRFRNEYGAHAGFTEQELSDLLKRDFEAVELLTSHYLHFKYGNRIPRGILGPICAEPVIKLVAPAVYAIARKPRVTMH